MPVGKIYNLVRPVGKFQASQRIAFAKECSSASAEHEKLNQEPLSQVIHLKAAFGAGSVTASIGP